MLAHHPTTGQPIRILRTGLEITADRKTLVWIRKGFKESHRWSRWLTVITEVEAVPLCNGSIHAVILSHDANIDVWLPVLPTIFCPESETLLFAPSAILTALETRGFKTEHAFAFEDLYDYYPYLGEPIVQDDSCEKVILSFAHIFRVASIVWTGPQVRDDLSVPCQTQYDAWIRACEYGTLQSVPLDTDDSIIPRTWLIQQYFRSANTRRANEILTCLEKNIACDYIDHILLLNEQEYSEIPVSSKITIRTLPHRLTYYDVFKAIVAAVPAGAYVIFSNADIWLNSTLRYIWEIGLKERSLFLALLRWEDNGQEPQVFGPRADSQDTWIVARDSITFEITEKDFGFPFGKSGCDNAITLIMMSKRFLVSNPAYSIKTMHMHNSNVRNYDPKDILYRSHYLYVDPTAIQPIKSIQNLERYHAPKEVMKAWNSRIGTSFARPLLGVRDSDAKYICDVLRLAGHTYIPHEQNLYTPPSTLCPLYYFKGGHFVTVDGRISSFTELMVGSYAEWRNGWELAKHSSMSPSIHVPNIIACPCDPICGQSLSKWVLHYLPRVLAIRDTIKQAHLPVPEFLVPQHQDIGAFLNDCIWNEERANITVTPMLSDMNYYSESVWAVPPTSNHEYITAEDIDVLRSLLPPANKTISSSPVAVFCVEDDEDAICTRGWAEETADKIMPKGWTIRYVSQTDLPSIRRKAFQDAAWIIGSGVSLDWMWYAQKGAHVLEFTTGRDYTDDHLHLAGAAGLRYVVSCINTEEHVVFQRQNALLDVGKSIKLFGFKEMLDAVHTLFQEKPRVLLPAGKALEGIHAHRGDGFRELVAIWGERGYVNVVPTEDSPYCWWGGIGDVLLYDRESVRWWHNIPPHQMALFGNCLPAGLLEAQRMRQSLWSFWPCHPRAIEDVVTRVENMRGYDSRPIASLFLGRVTNGIQKLARCKMDWSAAVELFSMPIDSSDTPYPYTQQEYLEKLCSARFGLSLPGSGQKCHREIEYFACGCVPIIVDGVDMKSYLVPPIEGIHYFKASTVDDVKRIVQTTPPDKWAAMSAAGRNWWRSYASAEGLFRLTWARIEQCKPYYNVGIPKSFTLF